MLLPTRAQGLRQAARTTHKYVAPGCRIPVQGSQNHAPTRSARSALNEDQEPQAKRMRQDAMTEREADIGGLVEYGSADTNEYPPQGCRPITCRDDGSRDRREEDYIVRESGHHGSCAPGMRRAAKERAMGAQLWKE